MTDQEFIKLPWNHPYYDDADRISQVMQLMKAGDNGRQAYKADRTRRDNPYPAHTALHEQWDTSFCQALHEDIAKGV